MTEFTKDNISAWRIWGEPPGYVEESLDEIERLQQRIAELQAENDKQKIAIANQGKIINQYQKQSTDLQYELDTIKNNPEAEKYYFEKWTELKQRIAELEQERRWIPVSERLPEDSRIYDVAIAGYEYSWTGTCVFGKWLGESGKAILGVTHWKYRPQPPEEETK